MTYTQNVEIWIDLTYIIASIGNMIDIDNVRIDDDHCVITGRHKMECTTVVEEPSSVHIKCENMLVPEKLENFIKMEMKDCETSVFVDAWED